MAGGDQTIVNMLCQLHEDLNKLNAKSDEIKTDNVFFISIPESGDRRSFSVGITKIDFKTGIIKNPDGTFETLSRKLDLTTHEYMRAVSLHPNQDIKFRLDGLGQKTVYAGYIFQLPFINYTTLEIECTVSSDISIFACTHPQATLDYFKLTVVNILEQESINGDTTEAQTWDAVANLKNNLNRIRKQIIDITGESWGTVTSSIQALFNTTTGHDHDGTDSKKVAAGDVISTAVGNLASTDVDSALQELDGEKAKVAHKATHITGGSDVIANVVAAGNSGLMTGADKTKLNGISTSADVANDEEPNLISCHNATGAEIAIRSVCYISGDQSGVPQITKAQANTAANASKMLVITTAAIANGAAGNCRALGKVSGFTARTAGAIQYLSDDTAGAIEETATTTATEIVRIIGYAISATVIYFNPDKTYIENA